MNEQELNKKLAEWAGIPLSPIEFGIPCVEGGYEPPNFTHSLDACFKHLVPELESRELQYLLRSMGSEGHMARLIALYPRPYRPRVVAEVWDKEPSLALCLAISKLIGQEVDNINE